jgi:hypothetical protein
MFRICSMFTPVIHSGSQWGVHSGYTRLYFKALLVRETNLNTTSPYIELTSALYLQLHLLQLAHR